MKKIYLPLALAATLTLGACSSDNVVDNGGSKPIDLSKGGFVKMSLNLPTDNNRGSRAELNDGLASEYGIKNAYLVLFEGKDEHNKENEATFKGAYELNSSDFENVGDTPNHVTLTKRIAFANDTKPAEGNKLYALVVLNNNGLFTVDATHTLTFATTNVNATDYASRANFINFSKAIASTNTDGETPFASDVANNGIFMTNAPLCTKPGGGTAPTGAKIKTLADVTSNIYTTEAEAKSKPAAEIYVERAVAKVTVQNKTGELVANQNNAASKISYKLYNWAVDNTNKKSYIVRQYDNNWNKLYSDKAADANKYRFVWSSPVNPNATNDNKLYRTAFAQDPEYATTTANADNYNRIASNASMSTAYGNSTAFGNDHPQYCNENTFQVTAQNQDQTTRVVLGVKMSAPGTTTYDEDLYTINDNKEVVYTKATLAERLKKILLQESDVKAWVAAHTTDASFVIAFNTDAAGATTIKEATFNGKTAAGATEETLKTFTTDLNKALPNIVRYKGGVAYYAVRIKHFGDTEGTPWNVAGQGVTAGGNSLIYPNPSAGASDGWFLGRYGVVRNNWYDISVNKIQTLGDATIPAFTNDPDDVLENYISVSINVLSWSKHTQDADL